MSKITLEFNDLDEKNDAIIALHGIDFLMSLSDIDNKLRSLEKYEGKNKFSIEEMREFIRETMDNYNVSLEMLI